MKKLRKTAALLLALLLALSVSAGALAASGKGLRSDQNNVTVKVKGVDGAAATVYHIVIDWDSLTFTYDYGETTQVWDTENHQYQTTTGTQGWDKTSATITITNHSNAAVGYTASFSNSDEQKSATVRDATATLDKTSGTVATAAQAPYLGTKNAPKETVTVAISGKPEKANSEFVVGTIYLTISAV